MKISRSFLLKMHADISHSFQEKMKAWDVANVKLHAS